VAAVYQTRTIVFSVMVFICSAHQQITLAGLLIGILVANFFQTTTIPTKPPQTNRQTRG
jgi:hypothetical protein